MPHKTIEEAIMATEETSRMEPSLSPSRVTCEWEPAEAANANYFYDLEPGKVKRAALWVRPIFRNLGLFRVRVAGPLPSWLRVSPMSFTPPAKLFVEVDATGIQVRRGKEVRNEITLRFILDE